VVAVKQALRLHSNGVLTRIKDAQVDVYKNDFLIKL
jgi:hypothetical protein